ncbi:MAG: FAD-binding protein, partial [Raoultibacter sp.]
MFTRGESEDGMKDIREAKKQDGQALSRRGFLQGAVVAGLAATGATIVGCSPQQPQAGNFKKEDADALAFAAEAEPIASVEPPVSWDVEVDVAVVGSGAGGMVGALRLKELGYSVALLEKEGTIGGASRYSGYFVNLGGHKLAEEAQWAWPSYPYDPDNIIEYLNEAWQMSADVPLLRAQVLEGPKCIDWMADYLGVPWAAGFGSPGSLYFEGQTTKMNTIMIN